MMGIVADFFESNELGRDVTRSEFLAKILEELPGYPDVMLVITSERTALINRNYVKVKVVNPQQNGDPNASDPE